MCKHKCVTGIIRNWVFNRKMNVIVGNIYNDANGRFDDGSLIQTSKLLKMSMQVESVKDGAIVSTLNSTYKLEGEKARGENV